MAGIKSAFLFIFQSVVVGLAVAFLVVLVRPDLLLLVNGDTTRLRSSYADAVEKSAPAVANVYTERLVEHLTGDGSQPNFLVNTGLASAVIVDSEGYLVTNYHVIAEAESIRVQLSDGRVAEPTTVGVDPETDIAVLKIDLDNLPVIPLGSSNDLRIGDVVLAIGNPYGLSKSVTQGIVSATGRGLLNLATFENFIQTDAAINTGNSGGALVNTRGELVGLNTAVLVQDASTEGISFAIPVDLVRGVVDEIRRNGRVVRGWMGLEPSNLTRAERDLLGLESNRGIMLLEVYEGGPADEANLRAGDVILSINNRPIQSSRQAQLIVGGTQPGDEVDLVVWRDGKEYQTRVTAGDRPEEVPATP
ncbi:MAG: trypsin-like peptidase domain-containing protein [Pseudomonadota bacterium]